MNVLASDSSSSIQEERKRVKKSTPKQMKQKRLESPEHKSAAILPTLTDPVEENTKELMICVENARQSPAFEVASKEPEELMELECLDEEEESYQGQVSVLLCEKYAYWKKLVAKIIHTEFLLHNVPPLGLLIWLLMWG